MTGLLPCNELLLVGCRSSDAYATRILDPRTGATVWNYRGQELQGGSAHQVVPLGSDAVDLVLVDAERPLLHTIGVAVRDKSYVKSTTAGRVTAAVGTRDGLVLIAAVDTRLCVWHTDNGQLASVVTPHLQPVVHLQLLADDSQLVLTTKDGALLIYLVSDVICNASSEGGPLKPWREWKAHDKAPACLSVSPGSSRSPVIATCGGDHLVQLFCADEPLSYLFQLSTERPLTACAVDAAESRLFIASDNAQVGVVSLNRTTDRRETTSWDVLPLLGDAGLQGADAKGNGGIRTLVVAPDGALVAGADSNGIVALWDVISLQCLKSITAISGAPVVTLQWIRRWRSLNEEQRQPGHSPPVRLAASAAATTDEKCAVSIPSTFAADVLKGPIVEAINA